MFDTRTRIAFAAAVGAALAGPALAGDGNVLVVRQESSLSGLPSNNLLVDQAGATNSLVIGASDGLQNSPDINNLSSQRLPESTLTNRPALQRGDNNSATITISGTGGEIQLIQDGTVNLDGPSSSPGNAPGNVANITASGDNALGAVLQFGDRNIATLDLTGENAVGLISQSGLNNTAELEVEANGSGQVIQNGNENQTSVGIESGTNAVITQNGNGLSVGQTALQVFSTNPGTISITQTGF